MAVNGGEYRLMRVNGRRYKKSREILDSFYIYSHFVAIYHLQGFRPISSATILQPLSLCVIDYALAYDVQLAINKHFPNALLACTLIGVLNIRCCLLDWRDL